MITSQKLISLEKFPNQRILKAILLQEEVCLQMQIEHKKEGQDGIYNVISNAVANLIDALLKAKIVTSDTILAENENKVLTLLTN